MTASTVWILCRDCEQPGTHNGRGLCEPCYRKNDRLGTLDRFPTVRGDREWRANYLLDATKAPPARPAEPEIGISGTWGMRAACRGVDPELFFPVSETGGPQVERAKAICRACPVLDDCADWVSGNPQQFGIWAALTSEERRRRRASQPERTSA